MPSFFSIFPQILFLGPGLAPLLVRIVLSLFVLLIGWERYKKTYKWISVIYLLTGVLVFIGLYTQIASIVGLLVIGFDYYVEKRTISMSKDKKIVYVFAGIILLSLLFTGPGFFSFDLPL